MKMAKREVQGFWYELPWHELQDGTTPLSPAAALILLRAGYCQHYLGHLASDHAMVVTQQRFTSIILLHCWQ